MWFWTKLEEFNSRIALITDAETLTYEQLLAAADEFRAEVRRGLPPGLSRPLVLVEASNEPPSVAAYLGALRAGWPVILSGGGARNERIVETYAPNVVHRKLASGWTTIHASPDPAAMDAGLSVMLSTSGTTGGPKLVRLSADNLDANARSIVEYLGLGPSERAITTLAFHYSYGMSVLHTHLSVGAALILNESPLVEPRFWERARRHGATSMALVPTQFEVLEKMGFTGEELPSLRYITQAGGKLNARLGQMFAERSLARGWKLFIMYGQTEASPRISYVPPSHVATHHHTIGRAIPGGTLRLVDAEGRAIDEAGRAGELVYEGPNVMMGYALGRDDLALPKGPPRLHTGDIAERTEDGFFVITGRAARFIKPFGLRISLDAVETDLKAEGRAVVCSGTDDGLVLFTTEATDGRAFGKSVAARYALPPEAVRVVALNELPLLPSGKVDYQALKQRAEAEFAQRPAAANNLLDQLRQALASRELELDRSFVDHGADSLAYLRVQAYLTERHGDVPQGWEREPLRRLLSLESRGARPLAVRASADLLWRVIALLSVIALHATRWPAGGGGYLLLTLTGVSLARFQSGVLFEGRVRRTLRTMLWQVLVCYLALITLVHFAYQPVDVRWFLLLGNFVERVEPTGLTPYWFVSAYAQIVCLATVPFLFPTVRSKVARAPFPSGIIALIGVALLFQVSGVQDVFVSIRHRHPVAALELMVIGWCAFHSTTTRERVGLLTLLVGLFLLQWRELGVSVVSMLALGIICVVWRLSVPVPARFNRWLLQFGGLSLFIYLAHSPAISLVKGFVKGPDVATWLAAVVASVALAVVLRRGYELGAAALRSLLRPWQPRPRTLD